MRSAAEQTPRPFALFALSVTAVGWLAFALSWSAFPPRIDLTLGLLVLSAALSELFSFSFPIHSMSLAYPLSMSAAVLGGPAAACLVSAVSSVSIQDVKSHRPPLILAFNSGQLLLASAVGGWAYVLLGGRVLVTSQGYSQLTSADFPNALLGMIAAAVLSYGMNMLLTSVGVSLYRRASFKATIRSGASLIPTQMALASVGFLMAQVMALAAVALPLFIFPLAVGRQYYQRYVGLKEAYSDTIRSLIGALEAKDPYTRGHSVRVAAYARQTGSALGFDDRQLERLEYSALLHDLGKLAMPARILTKEAALDEEEYAAMRNHPAAGAEMIDKVPPLRDLAPLVRGHHERPDGSGYPDGILGDSIPLAARVLSVVDAYDAMTTDRAYRRALEYPEAVAELERGRGAQFDDAIVTAFLQTLSEQHGEPRTGGAAQ